MKVITVTIVGINPNQMPINVLRGHQKLSPLDQHWVYYKKRG